MPKPYKKPLVFGGGEGTRIATRVVKVKPPLTDEQKLVRATKMARRKTTLGKIEELKKELSVERRRLTAARARVEKITDRLVELAESLATPRFEAELEPTTAQVVERMTT